MQVPTMLSMADVMAESEYSEEQVFDLGLSGSLVFLIVVPEVGACRVPTSALSHFMAGAERHEADAMPEHYSGSLSGKWAISKDRLRILPASWHKWTEDAMEIARLDDAATKREAVASAREGSYQQLEKQVEPYIDAPFSGLPTDLAQRVKSAFLVDWDCLAGVQRMSVARQHDAQHDPAMAQENAYWWALTCRQDEVETAISDWRSKPDVLPSEAKIKQQELAELQEKLERLKQLWSKPAFFAPEFGTPGATAPASALSIVSAPIEVPIDLTKTPFTRRSVWDVVTPYVVETLRSGQYTTAKELFKALESSVGHPSPFDKGTDSNRYSLYVREIRQSLSLKTVQNQWPKLVAKAADK